MPTIAIIDGVRIVMYWNDHTPPHFHALVAEHRAVIEIDALTMVGGYLAETQAAKCSQMGRISAGRTPRRMA
jgi:hypothetical protein